MATTTDQERAIELIGEAMKLQMAEEFDDAIRLYKESIALYPTADAHTYLGWAYSFKGRLNEAIAQCEIAIELDPEFGNPYNDIGVYLMQQQKLDDAIPWLERAKSAKRYEPRHFPYINLGRVYLTKGMIQKALEEFGGALRSIQATQTWPKPSSNWKPSCNDRRPGTRSWYSCRRLAVQLRQNRVEDTDGGVYFLPFHNQRRAKPNRALTATE